ncbi:hypothetical protein K9N68_03190 [Kovacikia minuta CCNUW1]|uniref:hypothetical protein n=1 Tax=Kovacikia minuta TaxID=2931930 RepID=UPI001CCD56B4|nr:hypothetical protein [Kovacikia minuta]UBF26999.1 hypothetical protein K9N68_03190 [Kovacikia minuta CCNUW1]
MQLIELKFLLKLIGFPNYRAKITDEKLKPSDKTSAIERDKVCRTLGERGIVDYSREVSKFKIDLTGKALLKSNTTEVALTNEQLKVLQACEKEAIPPGKVKGIAAEERQSVIQDLQAKGFIKVEKETIKEVWLTNQGHEYLIEECLPSGNTTISLNLLKNYLIFLRKATQSSVTNSTTQPSTLIEAPSNSPNFSAKPDDEKILETIKALDEEIGTENYLPIFHLRQKLQPPLSRDELDQALYRLQRQDKIDISSLVEAIHYTPEQIQAGIPQDSAGPLFFLVVNG